MDINGVTIFPNGDRKFDCRWGLDCTATMTTTGRVPDDWIEVSGSLYICPLHRNIEDMGAPTIGIIGYTCGWTNDASCGHTDPGNPSDWIQVTWRTALGEVWIHPDHLRIIDLDDADALIEYDEEYDNVVPVDTICKRYVEYLE